MGSVCVHAIKELCLPVDSILVLFNADTPLFSPEDIDGVVDLLLMHPDANSASVVADEKVRPFHLFKQRGTGYLEYAIPGPHLERRQVGSLITLRVSGPVAAKVSAVLENKNDFMSPPIVGYPVPQERICDVHTIYDLERAEWILGRRQHKG